MPALTKTRPIKKLVQVALQWPDKIPETYTLPSAQARLVANLIRELVQKANADTDEDLSWRAAAKKELQKHGKRTIGKAMAKRLATILRAPDYRLFL